MGKGKKFFADYSLITVGAFLVAAGLQLFLVPFKYSSGGIGTLSTILFYFSKIPISLSYLVLNAFLFIFGWRYLGKNAVIKSLAGSLLLSLFLQLCTYIPIDINDKFISFVMGGILDGLGTGLVIRAEASTGGVDLAALIIKHFFPHLSVATVIFVINGMLLGISGIAFKSFSVAFYSITAMFVSEKILEMILNVGVSAKSVLIISDEYQEIKNLIYSKYDRGVTQFESKSLLGDRDKTSLICVATPKEVSKIIRDIKSVDSTAFVVVSDVKEVIGRGFTY